MVHGDAFIQDALLTPDLPSLVVSYANITQLPIRAALGCRVYFTGTYNTAGIVERITVFGVVVNGYLCEISNTTANASTPIITRDNERYQFAVTDLSEELSTPLDTHAILPAPLPPLVDVNLAIGHCTPPDTATIPRKRLSDTPHATKKPRPNEDSDEEEIPISAIRIKPFVPPITPITPPDTSSLLTPMTSLTIKKRKFSASPASQL